MVCSFCEINEKEGFFKSYCLDCAMLRRMLVLHEPSKCVDILKRCLLRNPQQITNKINIELKKNIATTGTSVAEANDNNDYDKKPTTSKPNTRSALVKK